jgi:type I restriction enzyme M protein
MNSIGQEEFDDFNKLSTIVDNKLKSKSIKLSTPEKKNILNAVSWYCESAQKIIKQSIKLSGEKLNQLLKRYDCSIEDLPNFGFYPTNKSGEFQTYETSSELRDSEFIPLNQQIYQYFLDEVKPHVSEAWINLETVKIGYEISFNKHFYRHKPLRSLEEVAEDIINLEQKTEGLIAQILDIELAHVQGEKDLV